MSEEGTARDVSSRDDWMKRTGPLYPGLVATRILTRVPVLRGVEPTEEDRTRSVPWFPVIGALVGGAAGLLALIGLGIDLVPTLVAVVVLAGVVIVRGAMLEVALARLADHIASPEQDLLDRIGGGLGIAGILALLGLLLVRVISFIGIDTDDWVRALVVSQVLAAWAVLFLLKIGTQPDGTDHTEPDGLAVGSFEWSQLGIASGIALVVAVAFGTWTGLFSMMIAGLVAFGVGLAFQRRGDEIGHLQLATAAALCELAVFFCFAIGHPAKYSPWVS